jgi:hypothetical protein
MNQITELPMPGTKALDATEKYSLADIFNVATENLIFEREITP